MQKFGVAACCWSEPGRQFLENLPGLPRYRNLGAPPVVRVSPSQLEACTNNIDKVNVNNIVIKPNSHVEETDLLSALEDLQRVQP